MKAIFKPTTIILVVFVLLLVGTSYFLGLSQSKGKTKDVTPDEIIENMVKTETITTDLISRGYIQIGFEIQANSTDAKEELTKRDFQVRNIAIRLLSGMNEEQVKNPVEMGKFETEMKNEINNLMQKGKVVKVYTTNKMIQ
ncbi:MAG: flagellar basal body-associated protein FliL [Bacillales bacterium]|jgi:flagellar FliL protein|nr:flagellar basal body-associated protein FliL [Bacillales bacterium]